MSNIYGNNYINNNDFRYTQSFQQPLTNPNRVSSNPFSNNKNQNNFNKKPNQNTNYASNQRYTVAAPFPSDSLFDIESTNSVLGFIPPEPKSKFAPSSQIKKISNHIKIKSNNANADINSENVYRNKRAPMDEISINNSNNRFFQSKSPINSGMINNQKNFRNRILNKDNFNNLNKNINVNNNNIKNNNNNLNNSANINNNIINKLNLQKKIQINNNINNNNNNPNIRNLQNNNNKNQDNNSIYTSIERTNLQNQFMNRSIAISLMLKKIQFFEKLNKIGKERMKIFENEFQKDTFFMKKDFFDNIFINEAEIDKISPLTLIFHFIFNPQTEISQYPYKKSFFESIFQMRGDKNIKIIFSPNDLKQVPKYFDNFNYVNNLFNNFNENDLIRFIEEIEQWKKIFSFELQFVHPLNNNIGQNQIEINDVAKIYFVSPNDLIVDYHSYADNFPLSDTFVSISQYNFHCDIKFDKNRGRFSFKTSAIVYNKLQIIKENIIQNVIKKEANNINSVELPIHTWKPLLSIIGEESKKNKVISDKIFKDHIRQTLNKYSKNKPQLNYGEEKNKIDNNSKNNNIINKINNTKINQNDINKNDNNKIIFEEKANNKLRAVNKKLENKINIIDDNMNNIKNNINNQESNLNNKINNFTYNVNNFKGNNNDNINNDIILEKEKINNNNNIINSNNTKDKIYKEENNINTSNKTNNEINKINTKTEEENPYLFYGVFITFFLFVFKTILSIENWNISSETIFNVFIVIIIGFMLIKNHIIDNNQ